jgi:cold shock protein
MMKSATLLFWNRNRAFGFAACDDGSPDVFVHAANLPANRRIAAEGDRISFDLGERAGRPIALNIQFLTPVDGSKS